MNALLLALAILTGPTAASDDSGRRWRDGGLRAAIAEAQGSGTPILLEFSTRDCSWCQRLHAQTWADETVQVELARWVRVRLDLSTDENGVVAHQEAADLGNRFGIARFPTLIALRPDGTPEDVIAGYLNASAMQGELVRIRRGEGTLGDLERRAAATLEDLEMRHRLALKRYSLGDFAGFQTEVEFIERADPEGRSLPMRRTALGQMREEMFGCMRGARPVDPQPLLAFLRGETHPAILCEGWSVLGTVYRHLGRPQDMAKAWEAAWKNAPAEERLSCGNALAWDYWEARETLTGTQRAFALEVSRTVTRELGDARGDDALRASFLDTLACCYFMNADREQAIETALACIRLVPDSPEYADRLEAFRAPSR